MTFSKTRTNGLAADGPYSLAWEELPTIPISVSGCMKDKYSICPLSFNTNIALNRVSRPAQKIHVPLLRGGFFHARLSL